MAAEDAGIADPQPLPVAAPSMTRPVTNVSAVVSLLCGVTGLMPCIGWITAPLSLLVGLRALVQIRANPGKYAGRLFAQTGIAIGAVAIILWIIGFWWWNQHARRPMLDGPREGLIAGLHGDLASFRAGFVGDGATTADAEANGFLSQLSGRYGGLVDSQQEKTDKKGLPAANQFEPVVPYAMRFDRAIVQARAAFVIRSPGSMLPVLKWRWIRIIDPAGGDLVYPASAAAASEVAVVPASSQPTP